MWVHALRAWENGHTLMTIKLYTDEELQELRNIRKRVTNPGAHWLEKPTHKPVHRQRSFKVHSEQNEILRFEIYQRQSIWDDQDFSCGIACLPIGGSRLTLARYNGPSHQHRDIFYRPHIHCATARAIAAGRRAESEAKVTDRYETLEGALACLIDDFHLTGISAQFDQPRLFR